MANALNQMLIDFSDLPIAAAYVEKDDDINLFIAWQNKAADALWDDYDLNEDVDLKLQIIQAFSHSAPTSFTHHLKENVQPCRFFVTEMG
ncbi:hypothetical protein, partial [Hydrogenovibrio marinus]